MALINCPECGSKISDEAKACPKCGKDISKLTYGPLTNFACYFNYLGVSLSVLFIFYHFFKLERFLPVYGQLYYYSFAILSASLIFDYLGIPKLGRKKQYYVLVWISIFVMIAASLFLMYFIKNF